MSLPSQKRKKGAMKATTRQATLDTIREDEATTLSRTLQDPTAIGSNAFRKTPSRSQRPQQQAKNFRLPSRQNKQNVPAAPLVFDVFQTLWRAINQQHTKSNLMFHLGQLERAIDGNSIDMLGDELAMIELILDRAAVPPPLRFEVVPPFIAILIAGHIDVIRDVNALAQDMSKDSDQDMPGRNSSMESNSNTSTQSVSLNVTKEDA